MASEKKSYSAQFKARIALQAIEQNKANLDVLAAKHGLSVSDILLWTAQLEQQAASLYDKPLDPEQLEHLEDTVEVVDVSVDDEDVSRGISFGVMTDNLNYKKLTFWSVFGVIFVVILVQLLLEMYQQSMSVNTARISATSEYYDVSEQKEAATKKLSSFGVVDIENGIYRMPIDSVINEMAVDGE